MPHQFATSAVRFQLRFWSAADVKRLWGSQATFHLAPLRLPLPGALRRAPSVL